MSVFFGTDGLRGIVGQELTGDVAYKCGNSLSQIMKKGRVVIGRDTRQTGTYLLSSVAAGLMAGGVDVVDAGIIPTAGIAYLTKAENFDYGIVLTASHNPKEYNGIKIFSKKGEKLEDKEEEKIERGFIKSVHVCAQEVGQLTKDEKLKNKYFNYLLSCATRRFDGVKIVLDCSFGASYYLAPKVFSKLGATVVKTSCANNGKLINKDCGSLHPEKLIARLKKERADIGFCFDGDADRLIAVNERGEVVDGDKILTCLALYLKSKGELNHNIVVGTSMTNMGIEAALERNKIKLLRADVGDKYVASVMFSQGLSIGGEQSGHIILSKFMHTGDGILTALTLLCAWLDSGKKFSSFSDIEIYPQVTLNVAVKEKLRILGSETLANAIASVQQELAGHGRVLVRASGTEPKIRIMVESESEAKSMSLAKYLAGTISTLENAEESLCVE